MKKYDWKHILIMAFSLGMHGTCILFGMGYSLDNMYSFPIGIPMVVILSALSKIIFLFSMFWLFLIKTDNKKIVLVNNILVSIGISIPLIYIWGIIGLILIRIKENIPDTVLIHVANMLEIIAKPFFYVESMITSWFRVFVRLMLETIMVYLIVLFIKKKKTINEI